MNDYVRIEVENGRQVTVSASYAKAIGATPLEGVDATDRYGHPLAETDPAASESSAAEGYAAFGVKALKDEIDRRNAEREDGDQLSKSGKKDDLVAVLEADDHNHPSGSGDVASSQEENQ